MLRHSRLRPIPLGLLLAASLTASAAGDEVRDQEIEARLLSEFRQAYASTAAPASTEVTFELRAAPTEVPQFDGRPFSVWAYNAQVPGPTLRVRLGESVRVVFRNDLPQPTTIHWHGVRVPNAMDGVPGVTQPAIPPGGTFIYQFTPKDAGTFWFHPHVRTSEQVERGLYGVLIVEDADPVPWSRDVVWVLDDWLLSAGRELYPHFNTPRDLAHDGRWGNAATVNGSTRTELVVRPGERIRLRLVNTANGRVFAPDFGGVDASVLAVDGMYASRPLSPAGFELAPGNRLDLDLRIGPDLAGRTIAIVDRFTRHPFQIATIRVLGESIEMAEFIPPSNPRVPGWKGSERVPPRAEYVLDARRGGEYGIEWTINGRAWGDALVAEEFSRLEPDRFHHLRFTNASSRLHPMHLHGQFFKVLARNGVPVDEPFFRDTVLLHRQETVDIGLVPLDWGRWLLHCHILEHAAAGMITAVDVPQASPGR